MLREREQSVRRPPAHTVILRRLIAINRKFETIDRRVKKRGASRNPSLAEIFRATLAKEMVQVSEGKQESIVLLYVLARMHLLERDLPAILAELRRCSCATIISLPAYKRLVTRLAREVARVPQTHQAT